MISQETKDNLKFVGLCAGYFLVAGTATYLTYKWFGKYIAKQVVALMV